jgi:acetone carboxylase gamma subunit
LILSKLIINQVIKYFVKHFKMDKIMSYVFDKNELDDKVKCLEDKVELLEKMAHPIREFVTCEKCKCKIKEKENG